MLIYMFVYIYQAKFLIEKYSFMDEKEKEPCRSRSQPWCPMSKTRCASHAAKAPVPQPLPHLSKAGRPWGLCCSLWVPSNKGMGEREETEIKRTGILHPFLLWPHVFELQPDELYHISKRRQEKSVTVLSFQLPVTSGCSGQKDTLPKTRTWKGDLAVPIPQPKKWRSLRSSLPPSPRSSDLALSLPSHLSSVSKPLGSPGLSCSFTVWFL